MHGTISNYMTTIDDLDSQTAHLEQVKKTRHEVYSKCTRLKGLSPIRRIPNEIMGMIFYHASHISDIQESTLRFRSHGSWEYDISTEGAPLVLLRVCKLWRDITLGTPSFFTQIILCTYTKTGCHYAHPQSITRKGFEYSGALPLEGSTEPAV